MGKLINGAWQDIWYDTQKNKGNFVRKEAQFQNWVTEDGSPGPTGEGGFKAEKGRYHLFVSLACPWAHRTLIFRALKGLESVITVSIAHPDMLSGGWRFESLPIHSNLRNIAEGTGYSRFLHEIYTHAEPEYSGRVTVPVLWDKKKKTIVNNESSEIIRMFNNAFNAHTKNRIDYYPPDLKGEIDEVNKQIYSSINNGVYKAGFATTQPAYEQAVTVLFEALSEVEERLSKRRYLLGDRITEADWRLFTTLIRFDAVYVGHFKCNIRCIEDYPNISNYLRDLYQIPGVKDTVDMVHIKQHYYKSQTTINPTQIVPKGPALDFSRPHDRARFSQHSEKHKKKALV